MKFLICACTPSTRSGITSGVTNEMCSSWPNVNDVDTWKFRSGDSSLRATTRA